MGTIAHQPAWVAISWDDAGCQIVAIAATRDEAEATMFRRFAELGFVDEDNERTEEDNGTLSLTDDRNIWHGWVIPLGISDLGGTA